MFDIPRTRPSPSPDPGRCLPAKQSGDSPLGTVPTEGPSGAATGDRAAGRHGSGTVLAPGAAMTPQSRRPGAAGPRAWPPESDARAALARRPWLEPRMRALVAGALGIDPGALAAGVSLADDLAEEPLRVLELALMLERELGAVLPEEPLSAVRTWEDLVVLVGAAAAVQDREASQRAGPAPTARARIVPGPGRPTRALERAIALTPYAIETLTDDAVQAGPGARLELQVLGTSAARALAAVARSFAHATARGVVVAVRSGRAPGRCGRAATG